MEFLTTPIALSLTPLDWLLVTVLGVGLPLSSFWSRRHFLRKPPKNIGQWRRQVYLENVFLLWGLCALGLLAWFAQDREAGAAALLLGESTWMFLLVTTLVGGACILLLRPMPVASAEKHRSTLEQLEDDPFVTAFIPAAESDMPRWLALSATAGITEEVLYRGLLIGTLTPLLGLPGAAILSIAIFSLGHAYQGAMGMLRVAGVGAVLTAVVWLAGSVWPAVILHIAVDVSSGRTVLLLKQLKRRLEREEGEKNTAAVPL